MAGALTLSDLAERFALDGAQAAALEAYVDLLSGWERANVTGLRSRERIVETLLGDSLAMLDVPQVRKRAGAGWLTASAAGRRPLWAVGASLPAHTSQLLYWGPATPAGKAPTPECGQPPPGPAQRPAPVRHPPRGATMVDAAAVRAAIKARATHVLDNKECVRRAFVGGMVASGGVGAGPG